MAKIQSHSGRSLPDTYDVIGSVAPIRDLVSEEVHLIHEMGGVIFSERLGSSILIMTTGDLLQTINFNIVTPILDMPGITRVLGVMVFADGDRVLNASLSMSDETANAEVAMWAWDGTADLALAQRVNVLGTVADRTLLRPVTLMGNLPAMAFGPGQRAQVPSFALRGTTTTFGGGTVEITAHIQIANADTGAPAALSSIGLPLPGW